MSESYYVGGYWGNQPEQPSESAVRTASLLAALASRDEVFKQWYPKGKSRSKARESPIGGSDDLRRMFEAGVNRRDLDGRAIEELGRRVALWNGRSDAGSSLSVRCGGSASTTKVWIPNSCVLTIPDDAPASDRLANVNALLAVLGDVVSAFDPKWALVDSSSSLHSAPPGTPVVGWITYLRDLDPESFTVPDGASVVRLEPGTVVVVTNQRFQASNHDHVSRARALERTLANRGVMDRVD